MTNGIGWLPLRSGHKKRRYLCERLSDTWTPSSSSMNTLGGEQMAHNVLVSCRGCSPMQRRWGKKNKNESPIDIADTQSLEKLPRQKHWPSRWWGLGPQGRRSGGYTTRYINKSDYQACHHMGQSRWKPLTRDLCFFGRADMAEEGYLQAGRRSTGSCHAKSVAKPPD